jgi:DNA-binding transcriptional LysR family regulator
MPLDVRPIQIGLYWHERYQTDPGHAWFRQYVTKQFQAVAHGSAPRP